MAASDRADAAARDENLAARPPPKGRMRKWSSAMFVRAMEQNLRNIERLLSSASPGGRLLDLGCNDGVHTARYARAARAREVHGIEIIAPRAREAEERGVHVAIADLDGVFPFADQTFDVVVSNQVIEHVRDIDNFVRETYRVLMRGGFAVMSTENLASWHNLASLVLGWQPFSLSNISATRLGLGNPLATQRGREPQLASWAHHYVFAPRGLRELFEEHGFKTVAAMGAGYYPLPGSLARFDSRHAAFLTLQALRPSGAPLTRGTATSLGC